LISPMHMEINSLVFSLLERIPLIKSCMVFWKATAEREPWREVIIASLDTKKSSQIQVFREDLFA